MLNLLIVILLYMTLQHEKLTNEEDKQKMELLQVEELSEVERRYTVTALTIFKERYLLKDNNGNTIERLDQLFKRVAVSAGLMEVLYDKTVYDKDGKQRKDIEQIKFCKKELKRIEKDNSNLDYTDIYNDDMITADWDGFIINTYHSEALLRRYIELAQEKKMKVTFLDIYTAIYEEPECKNRYLPLIKKYYELMSNAVFLPNTPTLMNAGTKLGQNAACFTLDIEDDLNDIYKTYADIAKIFKSGGGIGINYSKLRPEGAYVAGTGGKSSGTLSWLKGTDETTGRVAQGGKRRGASMGILNIDHPEIEKFIDLKDNKTLENHNISVCMNDLFMKIFVNDGSSRFKNLMDKITKNAWKTGDPGMVFLDNMNSNNRLLNVFKEPIQVTNPCSEISMYPYESCILASINLNKFIDEEKGRFDLEEFISVTRTVTKFLDNIIDATKYPLEKINKMTKNCRRIGVGYMGLADVLARLEIPYNSKDGFIFTEYVSAVMSMTSLLESNSMARYKGSFPLWNHKDYPKNSLPINGLYNSRYLEMRDDIESLSNKFSYRFTEDKNLISLIDDAYYLIETYDYLLRNCSVTTVAPTGTLSMFADCSMGIEPLFALEYTKKVTLGSFKYFDKNYEKAVKSGMDSDKLKKIFVTAMDIHPFDHIMMQSVAQRWISNGISKTINAPNNIDPKTIEHCYVLAWALGNKGTTVYRDKCKDVQVLNDSNSDSKKIQDMEISDYTKNQIMSLDNLPKEYKYEIKDKQHTEKVILTYQLTNGSYSSNTVISDSSYNIVTSSIYCHGCGATNSIHKNGSSSSCFICIICGSQIGGCN